MSTISLSARLDAPADVVWRALTRNADAFRFVTRGLIRYPATAAWVDSLRAGDELSGRLFLLGVLPFSQHTIRAVEVDRPKFRLVTEESGGAVRRWVHTITVRPTTEGSCLYTDELEIEAGPLTGAVTAFARVFYRIRQRRWRGLAPLLAVAAEPGRSESP